MHPPSSADSGLTVAPPTTAICNDPTALTGTVLEIVMAVCRTIVVHREPVGKRITAALRLADDPGGDTAGRRMI
jgi:hypothetical protein